MSQLKSKRSVFPLIVPFYVVGILALTALVIYLSTMSASQKDPEELVEVLPFLNNHDTIEYVRSSKLMVLVAKNEEVLKKISLLYGAKASCISEDDESRRRAAAKIACASGRHLIAIDVQNFQGTNLTAFSQLALDYNYILTVVNASKDMLPDYVGWHLNEADSSMLGHRAYAILEHLLCNVDEFRSDFQNFSNSKTITEMLKYYQLASSNHNGMLHCTANYFGQTPSSSSKAYYEKVADNITTSYKTTVIGLVFTPRTFGARVKLSSEQLQLWGGDDAKRNLKSDDGNISIASKIMGEDNEVVISLSSSFAQTSIHSASEEPSRYLIAAAKNIYSSPFKKESAPDFQEWPTSLVSSTLEKSSDDPDFHPVTGPGRKAHMTLGVAQNVSAVTTGYDLLEIVELEKQGGDRPTYNCSMGWLRDYSEGRWVLYMNNKITVDNLFAGVFNFSYFDTNTLQNVF